MTHNWGSGDPRTSTAAWRALRKQITTRDGNQCRQCGTSGTVAALELDHITNVKEGGTDHPTNAQLLCQPCHTRKTHNEAARGRQRKRARLKLPTQRHPGLR
ncbi:HNH endonuclease [Rhodococcus opacus]|uniref:HNH endonuclease n=1 Tax=Rhodococcus opacus TaxID=37919 RepID=UPI0029539EC8|nr:HNH endonuclease signature motif containing protein [Rhodococcus opacus]MDV7089481.1 HNH endonuclease signature motif containing protein [Rhodococcus opacus]